MPVRSKRFEIGTVPIRVDPTMPGRMIPQGSVVIRNRSSVSMFVGDATVSTTDGFELEPGESVATDIRAGDAVHVVAESGSTNRLDVLQFGGMS